MPERIAPSRAARLTKCSASGDLPTAIPGWVPPVVDQTKGAKGKGTEIHEALAAVVKHGGTDIDFMIEALQYFNEIRKRRRWKVAIEQEFTADFLDAGTPCYPDVVLYLQDEIHVFDWKTGGIEVDAFDNAQMKTYALCVAHLAPLAKEVHLHIVQPWARGGSNMSEYIVSTEQLLKWRDELIAAEVAINTHQLVFSPGDHCTFCPANPHSRGDKGHPLCPAMLDILYPRVVDEDAIIELALKED